MKRFLMNIVPLVVLCIGAENLGAQSTGSGSQTGEIHGSTTAISYLVNSGKTKIDLKATEVIPSAKGEAKVEAKEGVTFIEAEVENLVQPGQIDRVFLAYVLWAVSQDGRQANLGEILVNEKGKGSLKATTQMQTFSLFVTFEPYHSVRMPSEIVVLQNEIRTDTRGKLVVVDTYRLMKRSQYERGNPLALSTDFKTVPLQMYEARNAVEIAKLRGADKYAPEIYSKAESSLKDAERLLQQEADKKQIITAARQTEQLSEDSRALAAERREQERIAMEQQIAVERARNEAMAVAAADVAAITAADAQALADADARARAAVDAQALADVDTIRRQLLLQLALVLDARDTPRGIVVNMADVFFETGKYDLRPETRQKLTKLAGILVTQPGLDVDIEGYTDTTGSREFNQVLSEQRAKTVAAVLTEQGVPASNVKARGLGSAFPVADNNTAKGRHKNRRVEIIVSGQIIGRTIGSSSSSGSE